MATVATVMARAPAWVRARYGSAQFVEWINDLLEDLSGEPRLFKNLRVETGVTVDDHQWINRPANLREIFRIANPANESMQYNWSEVNGRIKLDSVDVDEADSPVAITSFSNYATTYINVNLAAATEDLYANYLFKITAGTYAGNTYIIDRNDASSAGTCRIYFRHPLSTALIAANVTAGQLISPDFYVLMTYSSTFPSVSSSSDEIPIEDNYERGLTSAWLSWKVLEEVANSSPECGKAEGTYSKALSKIKRELRTSTGGRIAPRYSPGWDQFKGNTEITKTYAEDI
jgi:hypothetical protein